VCPTDFGYPFAHLLPLRAAVREAADNAAAAQAADRAAGRRPPPEEKKCLLEEGGGPLLARLRAITPSERLRRQKLALFQVSE
jgi:hypothetical protein